MPDENRDIFICHASEDKDEIVRPLVEAFKKVEVSCWYDEAEIKWGDSITQKVNEGIAKSRFVIVVFSPAFLKKEWPQREYNAALNQEATSGVVRVLPLVVGSRTQQIKILDMYPLLNDKRYLPWDGGIQGIVDAMLARLGREANAISDNEQSLGFRIPLPKITKQVTQRDKDIFLRNSFRTIKNYFEEGLKELNTQYEEIETDFLEIHNFKFIATIYLRGEVAKRCKIWIGGFMSSDSIAYQTGKFNIESDNSYNDMLSIVDDKHSLGFQPSGLLSIGQQFLENNILNSEQAAEYLWRSFTHNLDNM